MRTIRTFCRTFAAQGAFLLVLAAALGGPGCGCRDDEGVLGSGCACDETLTFDLGSGGKGSSLPQNVVLVNLVQDPGTRCIGFGPTIATFPAVYMAASGRGTVVRIDTNTGNLLGEYATAPRGLNLDPSRTTVDKYGECWVGNRTNLAGPNPGSIMRVGVVDGGTRGDRLGPVGGPYTFSPNPAGQYVQGPFTYLSPSVADRDGDGFIHTSSGLGDVLPWDASATGGNDLGGVTLAEDEAIVTFTRVAPSGVRGLAIDCENDVWVGGFPSTTVRQRVSGTTGLVVLTRNVGPAYGEIIDRSSVLWSVDRSNGLHLHDIAANTTAFVPSGGLYGIAINPCDNTIWTSSWQFSSEPSFGVSGYLLRRWNSSGVLTGAWVQPGPAQGLSIDQNGDLWVSSVFYTSAGIWRFDSSGTLLATIPTGTFAVPATGTTGTAVDQNGAIWVSDLYGNAARRIDPAGPAVDLTVDMGPGSAPYNYSDMTGLVSLSSCGETGFLIATHDGLCAGLEWGRVTWQTQGETSTGCTVTAEVRASEDPLNYPTTWTPVSNGVSFCGSPVMAGRYIQVRATITRPPGCPPECDPKLCQLRIECCEGGVGQQNLEPIVTLEGPVSVPDPAGPTSQVEVRGRVVDPEGGAIDAFWSVGGVVVGPAVFDPMGRTSLLREFPDGITQVALTATDGTNTSTAETTVTVGDHEAPEVTCPSSPPVEGGAIVVRAFEAAIPDLVSGTVATDDVTIASALVVTQAPLAGTVVTQGNHVVVVTATDEAGNAGTCSVYFMVRSVVGVVGISSYNVFPAATPIPVSASYTVPTSDIAQTTVLVDGVVHTVVAGALVGSVDLNLSAGSHEVEIVVANAGMVESRSGPVLFGVN